MPDELTPEEIEAIESYQGGVQCVNRGESGVPLESVSWMEGNKSHFNRYNRTQKFVVSKERDDQVKRMVAENATISEISKATGLNRKSVKSRIERLKLVH